MPRGWEGNRIGLASHWPCVTDSSRQSTYGLNGQCVGDKHPPYAPDGARPGLTFCSLDENFQTRKFFDNFPPTQNFPLRHEATVASDFAR